MGSKIQAQIPSFSYPHYKILFFKIVISKIIYNFVFGMTSFAINLKINVKP